MVQRIGWWWLLQVETCRYMHNLTIINRCVWLKLCIQSSWEANSSSASEEILYILWHPTLHYYVQNSPPFVPVPSQINPIHVLTSISWRCTLILSSHVQLGLSSSLFPSGITTKIPYEFIFFPMQATCPAHLHSPSSRHPNVIWWQVQILKLLNMHFSAVS